MYKPGYKTSEFWFTLVSFIFSGLFLLGVIGENQQKEELISNVSHAVESCILIGGQLLILYKYIKGRTNVKSAFSETQKPNIETNNEPRNKRTNKRRTKKTSNRSSTSTTRNKKSSNS
jgi:hypothetical protein